MTTLRSRLARLEQHHAPAPHMTVVVTRIGDPDPDTERVHTCPRCGRQTTARGAETVVYCAPCPKRSTATTPPAGEA